MSRFRARLLWFLLLAPIALPALLALLFAWVVATESGTRFGLWTAQIILPGVGIESPAGTLLGPLRIGRLSYRSADRRISAEQVGIEWKPRRLMDRELAIDRLSIDRLRIDSRGDQPLQAPDDLRLPLALRVEALVIARIAFGALAEGESKPAVELSDVAARLASDGADHRIESLRFLTSRLTVEGSGRLQGLAPFPVAAAARIVGETEGHPFAVALSAAGTLRAMEVSARPESGALEVGGRAGLDLFAPRPLLRASLSATGLDPATWFAGAPHARLKVEAALTPVEGTASDLAGTLAVFNLDPGRLDQERIPLRSFQSRLRWQGKRLELPAFSAGFSGGGLKGSATLEDGRLTLDATVASLDASAWHKSLRKTRLGGSVDAVLSAAAQRLRADLAEPRFRLALDATREQGALHIETARLASKGASLELTGRFGAQGDYRLQGGLRNFDASLFADLPRSRLNARLDASGRMAEKPTMDLRFEMRDSTIAGRPALGRGDLVLHPDRLERAEVSLSAGDNRLEAKGQLGHARDVLTLTLNAPRLDQIGFGGEVQATASLSGALRDPAAEWKLSAPLLALPGGHRIKDLVSDGRLEPGDGGLRANVTVARFSSRARDPLVTDLGVRLEGRRSAHALQAAGSLAGSHRLELAARGGPDQDGGWSGQVDSMEWRGPHPARLVSPATVRVAADAVLVESARLSGRDWTGEIDRLRWQPGRLQSRGRFSGLQAAAFLQAAAPTSSLTLGAQWDIDFGERLAGHARVFREQGDLSLNAVQPLPLGLDRALLSAEFAGRQVRLALEATGARAGTARGTLALELRPHEGAWTLARTSPWRGALQLDVPSIAWASPLLGENVALEGRLQGGFTLAGTPAAPATSGQVTGNALALRLLNEGLELGGGVMQIDFSPDVARLRRLEFTSVATQRPLNRRIDFAALTAQPGHLTAEGEFALKKGEGRLKLVADRLTVSQLPNRWIMVSGNGALAFGEKQLGVSADVKVDGGYWELAPPGRPTLSEDIVVLGRENEARPMPRVSLDLAVNLGNNFHFHGAGIESRLAGQLHLVAARRDQLRATGFVRTVGGSFDAYGRKLSIERGILNFQGLIDNPGLNVRALRKNLAVEAGVEVGGTLKKPLVRLVSEPDVPDTEKLSWMVLGRPPGASLSAQDADLLLSAAMALRGDTGGAGGGPVRSLMQGLGLEELSLSSGSLTGRERSRTTHVAGVSGFGAAPATTAEQIATVGKRIGSNAVLSYERSLTTAESVLKLTVDLSRRISLIGRVGADNAVDLLYTFTFGGGAQRDGKEQPSRQPSADD